MFARLLIVLVAFLFVFQQAHGYKFSMGSKHSQRSFSGSEEKEAKRGRHGLVGPLFGSWGRMDQELFPCLSVSRALSNVQEVMDMMENLDQISSPRRGYAYVGSVQGGRGMGQGLSMEMSETSDSYEYTIELPGCKKEDLKLKVIGEELHMEAERSPRRAGPKKEEGESSPSTPTAAQKQKISRIFTLPEDAEKVGIEAVLEDGVLSLVIPKKKPLEPQVINVHIK